MNGNWKHIETIIGSQPYKIKGLNIWDHKWNYTGERAIVKDPKYGQTFNFPVIEIYSKEKKIRFILNSIISLFLKSRVLK